MASGQSNPLTYMDGVSVKIAENYKPPKRIPSVMSYSQRVVLNKLMQEPVLSYDFTMEASVKNKMCEWQKARTAIIEQRKQRLNQLKSWDSDKKETEVLDNKHEQSDRVNDPTSDPYYQIETGILIPKIVDNQQPKILTPIPTNAVESRDINNYQYNNKNIIFNYSEFESDTSSPFDNMELKTINDLEELAQVLKYDSDSDNATSKSLGVSQSEASVKNHYDNIYRNLEMPSYALQQKRIPINGYNFYTQNALTQEAKNDASVRTVSEIMKSLQADLANTRLNAEKSKSDTVFNDTTFTPSNTSAIGSIEMQDDPLKNLSPEQQKMALGISVMGFPLPRVARAVQVLQGNQKKILEHLLAMSDLLDLGFSEEQVESALLKCENDRDKALDLLIT